MPVIIAAGLEAVLNRYLRLDPDSLPRLAALEGTVIAIALEGTGWVVELAPGAHGVRVAEHATNDEPTVRIRATPLALARSWRGQRVTEGLVIEGDVTVGREFQAILMQLDIDWEEQISTLVGDAVAHQVGTVWRSLQHWGRQTGDTLLHNTREYLQHEMHALPPQHTVEPFLNAVDTLREDVDRLAARIERLHRYTAADRPL